MPSKPEANSQPVTKPPPIRAAKSEDIAAILALEQSEPHAAHWSPDHYQKRIQSQPQSACFLVAERETESRVEGRGKSQVHSRLQGFLCARIAAGEWEIENVVVDQEFRRQGTGTRLMESLIRNWEAAAAAALLLEVRASNTAARALYERQGLREVGRRRAYYGDPPEDAILYARYGKP